MGPRTMNRPMNDRGAVTPVTIGSGMLGARPDPLVGVPRAAEFLRPAAAAMSGL